MWVKEVGAPIIIKEYKDLQRNTSFEKIQEKGEDFCQRLKSICPTGNISSGCESGCNVFGTNGTDYWERDPLEGKIPVLDQRQTEEDKKLPEVKGDCDCTVTLQDVSDDPTVSFQTPTKVPKSRSTAEVIAHEYEHVAHERARAIREGRRVVISVKIDYEICPECGMRYAVGGTTTVRTIGTTELQGKGEKQTEVQEFTEGQEEDKNPLAIDEEPEEINGPAEMTPELEWKIVQMKKLRPDMDAKELKAWLLQQEGVGVSETEIKRILKKHQLLEDSPEPKSPLNEQDIKTWLEQTFGVEVSEEEIRRVLMEMDMDEEDFKALIKALMEMNEEDLKALMEMDEQEVMEETEGVSGVSEEISEDLGLNEEEASVNASLEGLKIGGKEKGITPEIKREIIKKKIENPEMDEQDIKTWLEQTFGVEVSEEEIRMVLMNANLGLNKEEKKGNFVSYYNRHNALGGLLDAVA